MGKKKNELRYVSIVFVRLELSSLPREKLSRFRKFITEKLKDMVDSLKGLFIPLGDRYLIVYGYPKSFEDYSERALNTALHLKKKIMGRIEGVYVKTGIASGEVIISTPDFGPPEVLGDAVNISARLTEIAENGEILCDSNTHSIVKHRYEFLQKGEIKLRGKKHGIMVYALQDRRKGILRKRSFGQEHFHFVDREKELFLLKKFVDDTFTDEIGRFVFLLGEAGIGKSRLVEEVYSYALSTSLENMLQFQWYEGKCNRGLDTVAFQPFIEIIRGFIGEWIDGNPEKIREEIKKFTQSQEELEMIMRVLGYGRKLTGISEKTGKGMLLNALYNFLLGIAERLPTVFVIDDLYSADTSSLEFLEYLSGRITRVPFLMIIISRVDKNQPFWKVKENMLKMLGSNGVEVYLNRLDRDYAIKLIHEIKSGVSIPEDIVNKAVELSNGNPLYLEEFIRYYLENPSKDALNIPPTIRGLIDSRIDSLDPDTREVLEETSVLGYRVNKRLLEKITRHYDDLTHHITKLINASILTDVSDEKEEKLYFYHPFYREAAYMRMLSKHKKELHRKIAETIEREYPTELHEFYEELARHYKHAGERDKAGQYAYLAAEKSDRAYAIPEAIKYYKTALELTEEREKRLNLILKVSELYRVSGKGKDALKWLEKAEEVVRTGEEKIRLFNAYGSTYERMSMFDEAIEYYRKGIAIKGKEQFSKKIPLYLGIAWIYYLRGKHKEVEEAIKKITLYLEDIKEPDALEKQYISRAYNILASTHNATGRQESSFRLYIKALRIYRSLGDEAGISTIYNNLSGIYSGIGDFLSSIKFLEYAYDIDVKMGSLLGSAIALYNIGENYLELNQLDMAEEYFSRYLELNDKIHNILGNGYGNWGMGRVYMEKKDYKRAEEYFERAIKILDELKAETVKMFAVLSLIDLKLRTGDLKSAEKLIEKYRNKIMKTSSPDLLSAIYLFSGILFMQRGDLEKAEIELIASLNYAHKGGEVLFTLKVYYTLFKLYKSSREDIQSEFYIKRGIGLLQSLKVFIEDEHYRKTFFEREFISEMLRIKGSEF